MQEKDGGGYVCRRYAKKGLFNLGPGKPDPVPLVWRDWGIGLVAVSGWASPLLQSSPSRHMRAASPSSRIRCRTWSVSPYASSIRGRGQFPSDPGLHFSRLSFYVYLVTRSREFFFESGFPRKGSGASLFCPLLFFYDGVLNMKTLF